MDRYYGLPIGDADFVWALEVVARLHGKPFDAQLIRQLFPPPHSIAALIAAADELGFEGHVEFDGLDRLAPTDLPCIAVLIAQTPATDVPAVSAVPGSQQNRGDPEKSPVADQVSGELALVTAFNAERVEYFSRHSQRSVKISRKEYATRSTGNVIRLALRETPPQDTDALGQTRPEFGFRWFIPELLKHKKIWRDVLAASLAIQVLALATPLFTQVIIDKVVVHQTLSTLTVVGIGLVMFLLFSAAMSWARQYLILHTGNRVDAVLGLEVFSHLLKLPPRYFENRPTGVIVTRVHAVETIREFIASAAIALVLDLPFLLIFVAVMYWYSVLLTLIAIGFVVTIAIVSLAIVPTLRARLNEQFLLGARNQAFLTEYISGVETVKSLQMEPQLTRTFGDYLAAYLRAGFRTRKLSNTYTVATSTLEQMMTVSILCIGAWYVINNVGFTIGMLVAFNMFAGRLSQPVMRIAGLWQEFQQAVIAVRRLGDVMNAPPEPYSTVPARSSNAQGHIEIENLAFRYQEDRPYLFRGLNLTVDAGKAIAIMGPSGSGKSTLAKLLQGFYQPTEGRIRIDGVDTRHLSANELRNYFGVVPQDTVLFSGTVYENLLVANPGASFEDVIGACKMAEIHDVIEQLPKGYQTTIGEHGAGLSGGQKQRVAIARALIKQPCILLFDESTSNLDEETADAFGERINALRGKATIIVITHRLPKTLRDLPIVQLEGEGAASEAGNTKQ